MYQNKTNYFLLIISIVVSAALLVVAFFRIQVNTDVVASLPNNNGVIADAVYLFKNPKLMQMMGQ